MRVTEEELIELIQGMVEEELENLELAEELYEYDLFEEDEDYDEDDLAEESFESPFY